MKMKALLIVALFAIAFVCCKKDSESSSAPVKIYLTDNPADYEEVNVQIIEIKVKTSKDTAGWVSLQTIPGIYNLLALQNGVTRLLVDDVISAGILKEVRFILGPENSVKIDGQVYPLQTPSAEDAGLKVKIDKHLNETLNSFTLDFDADLSVKQKGDGSYMLSPVIKLK